MTGPAVDPRDLRVSDDERSHVLGLLEKATGRGLIDLAEYQRRSAVVIQARTRAELNATVVDLPGLLIAGRSIAAAEAATATGSARVFPGYSGAVAADAAGVLELTGWGSRSYRGHWSVPAVIVIGGFGAATKLDFSQATLTSTAVTIEFRSNFGGTTELIVPRGASVRFDGLSMRGGSVNNKIAPGGAGVLDLMLTGVKKGGAVNVRHPRPGIFGR